MCINAFIFNHLIGEELRMLTNSTNQTSSHESNINSELEFIFTRSIEFRQETIYFIMVDRFFDGDSNNNEGPNPNLYDPNKEKWGLYWGGDLQGIIDKLSYLKNMGVTAIWMTPLFEQIEDNPQLNFLYEVNNMGKSWDKNITQQLN